MRSLCHLGEVTTASGCPYGRSRQTGSSESAPPPLNLQLHLPRPRSYTTCKSFHRISFHPLGKLDGLSLLRHHYFHVFLPRLTIQSKQVGCRRSLIFIYMWQSQTHGTGHTQVTLKAHGVVILATPWYQLTLPESIKANVSFEEEIVKYTHAYDGKIILFEKCITHDRITFHC